MVPMAMATGCLSSLMENGYFRQKLPSAELSICWTSSPPYQSSCQRYERLNQVGSGRVAKLTGAFQISSIVLIGHDVGGILVNQAIILAERYPDRFGSMSLKTSKLVSASSVPFA